MTRRRPDEAGDGGRRRRLIAYGTSLSAEHSLRFWRRCGGAWVGQLRALANAGALPFEVIGAARWGADSRWGVRRLARRVLARAPDVVLLEFAINDADQRRGLPVKEARQNLETMLDALAERLPECEVLPTVTLVPAGRHAEVRPALADYYAMYREVAERRGLGLIDQTSAWDTALRDPADWRRCLPDGIHPSADGCREVVLPSVLAALGTLAAAQ